MRNQLLTMICPLMLLVIGCGKMEHKSLELPTLDTGHVEVQPIDPSLGFAPVQNPAADPLDQPNKTPDAVVVVVPNLDQIVSPVEIEVVEHTEEPPVLEDSDSADSVSNTAPPVVPETVESPSKPDDSLVPSSIQIPEALFVVSGQVGNHKVILRVGGINCEYRAESKNSSTLKFKKCSDGFLPGMIVQSDKPYEIQAYGIHEVIEYQPL